jgi:hypothetical protein
MATNTYVALDKVTVGTATPSVTFSSIPQGYTDLFLIIKATALSDNYNLRFNGDTGTNYSDTNFWGNGSSAASYRSSNNTVIGLTYTASGAPMSRINILNYSNTTTYKTSLTRQDDYSNAAGAAIGLWRNTAAITSISIVSPGNIPVGSTFSLYGIKAEGNTVGTTKATGGTIIKDNFGYVYHTFTASGTFAPTANITDAEALVVAGGGGAGGTWSGGGGAGGLRGLSALSFANATNYAVTVGAGGAGGGSNYAAGTDGINSSIIGGAISQSSTGGGRGPATFDSTEYPGGSGGGGWGSYNGASGVISDYGSAGNAGSYNPPEGYAGGYGIYENSVRPGGGGGGAGGVGANATTGGPGNGGIGSSAFSSWGQVTSTGQYSNGLRYYAGGGGGGKQGGGSSGGLGGGGGHFTSGTPYTGGGAGGGGDNIAGGSGGSGIVIIRYYGL